MIEINVRDITDINKEFIVYINTDGEEKHINLSICVEQYKILNSNINHSSRCVGERAFPKFHLHEQEEIWIFVQLKPLNKFQKLIQRIFDWTFYYKEMSMFYSIQKRLNENGWTTLDLT